MAVCSSLGPPARFPNATRHSSGELTRPAGRKPPLLIPSPGSDGMGVSVPVVSLRSTTGYYGTPFGVRTFVGNGQRKAGERGLEGPEKRESNSSRQVGIRPE